MYEKMDEKIGLCFIDCIQYNNSFRIYFQKKRLLIYIQKYKNLKNTKSIISKTKLATLIYGALHAIEGNSEEVKAKLIELPIGLIGAKVDCQHLFGQIL